MNDLSVKHLAKLAEKNSKVVKILDEGKKAPLIGIFWMHPRTNKIISPYSEPLETAVRDHDLHVTDASVTHSSLWPLVKDHHPDLSHLKYDQVPRARVFYHHDTEKFHVWGPKKHLEDPKIQGQILSTFNLRRAKTVFEPNQDYEKERGAD